MRKESSIKNIIYAYIGQFFGIIVNFVARIVFIKVLNTEYLGINGLFTNILSVLALAELGVGAAMAFNLYEPLAKNDTKKIKALMNLYKKAYNIIGIFILIAGIVVTPFIYSFMNEVPNIEHLQFYYILYVVNSAVSYFFTYKRTLLVSAQKRYIATFYRYLFYALVNIGQIIILLFTKNYTLYLLCQILFTILENICVSKKTEEIYPYIKEKNTEKLDKETSSKIFRDIKAMFMNRLGVTVVKFTDTIIISKFLGVIEVGLYSNYQMITTSLTTIITQIFTSITASIGDFAVTETKEKTEKLFYRIFFMDFWIYTVVSVCLITVTNPFIKFWVGEEYLLHNTIVIALIINFYLSGMRLTITTLKDALGLYWRDKYRPLITAIVNLVTSIILVKHIGILGVILGTIISTMAVDLIVEPYVLYKYTFNKNVIGYYKRYFIYTGIFLIMATILGILCANINIANSLLEVLVKGILTFVISNIVLIVIYHKNENYTYMKQTIMTAINMFKNKFIHIGEKNEENIE